MKRDFVDLDTIQKLIKRLTGVDVYNLQNRKADTTNALTCYFYLADKYTKHSGNYLQSKVGRTHPAHIYHLNRAEKFASNPKDPATVLIKQAEAELIGHNARRTEVLYRYHRLKAHFYQKQMLNL